MSMIRSFIAIELNEQTKEKLSAIQNRVKKTEADLKLVNTDNIHLTLHFLGDIEIPKIDLLKKNIAPIVKELSNFIIKPHGIGAFPNIKSPRIIWVGIEGGTTELMTIQERIGSELNRLGLEPEKRKFHPHLTLARVKSEKNKHILAKALKEFPPLQFDEIPVCEIALFKSTLSLQGPIYEVLKKWKLSG